MQLTRRPLFTVFAWVLAISVSACATQTPEQRASGEIHDPFEQTNRSIHAFNVGVDRVLFGPASKGYAGVIPDPILDSVTYFADNLSMPSYALNSVLQGKFKQAGVATLRFALNTTIGFAGLADPATEFDIPAVDTDFGETLHVWGFGEGAYVEIPLYGPSTTRDAIGVFTDAFTSPLSFTPTRPIKNAGVIAEVLKRMGDRGRYSATVDSILYGSADSYAQARIIYLQNRRFELAGDSGDDYSDPYADPYLDPYEDIYAE